MKKSCELCSRAARMYCDSDQASLCWDCDERVHSANFLVAKHTRNLLCHVCQSVTQWKASGSKFGPTFSVCQRCFNNEEGGSGRRDQEEEDHQEPETTTMDRVGGDSDEEEEYSHSEEEEDDDDDDDFEEEEEEEDGENQVVPWTTPPSVSPSPPVATTSGSEIGSFSTRDAAVDSDLKRFRENTFPDSEDEDGCCSSQVNIAAGVATTTRIIGKSVGLSQQRCDSEGKRVRKMDAASSFMRFQER